MRGTWSIYCVIGRQEINPYSITDNSIWRNCRTNLWQEYESESECKWYHKYSGQFYYLFMLCIARPSFSDHTLRISLVKICVIEEKMDADKKQAIQSLCPLCTLVPFEYRVGENTWPLRAYCENNHKIQYNTLMTLNGWQILQSFLQSSLGCCRGCRIRAYVALRRAIHWERLLIKKNRHMNAWRKIQ